MTKQYTIKALEWKEKQYRRSTKRTLYYANGVAGSYTIIKLAGDLYTLMCNNKKLDFGYLAEMKAAANAHHFEQLGRWLVEVEPTDTRPQSLLDEVEEAPHSAFDGCGCFKTPTETTK
mgnify:CR=1 FL=1|jgi:hypothetical protein